MARTIRCGIWEMIKIKKLVKKIKGVWEFINPKDILSDDDIDDLVVVTTSGRKFKIKELKKRLEDQ